MTEEPRDATGRLEEALAARRAKLERLRAGGFDPFPLRFDRDASLSEVREKHAGLGPDADTDDRVRVAGRIMLLRRQGKISFATIRDASGDLQLFLAGDAMGAEGVALLNELDLGDIVGAEGVVMTTKRGELSIRVKRLTLLAKALRPLPEKWHGLKDPDAKQRRRYLDLATSLESREVVRVRAIVLKTFRRVLDEHGFVEVETPVLQPMASGAIARPFTTHHEALDIDLFLRIAPELYLKRLLVGGFERVYEIGRNFRNEGIDRDHNPEFTMLEFYQAYGSYEDMMRMAEELIRAAALEVRGSLAFEYQGHLLDLEPPWRRLPLLEAVSEAIGREVTLDETSLRAAAEVAGVNPSPAHGPAEILKELYEKKVEPSLFDPVFITDFPREISPLARPHRSKPGLTEQFDLVIAGMEMGPAYSELNDPDEQRARFEMQRKAKEAGDEEAHPYDMDFLEALEHAMPPAGGIGIGVDRVTMLLADAYSIRDVILFPHVRPEAGRD